MEYAAGTALTLSCDERQLSIRERLQLFLQVLETVQFAHAQLIIHRDLKPANILVTAHGKVTLLDFGIGKLITEGSAPATQFGRALTPDYASPEQIAGKPLGVASDIYSLGVILYELLTGTRPYRLRLESLGALEDAILNETIRAPSQVAVSVLEAAKRKTPARDLAKALAGDLDTIVLKALKKLPSERYISATALAQDISNYLKHLPVSARPDSFWYRSSRVVMRYRWPIISIAITLVTAGTGTVSSAWQARAADRERDRAIELATRNASIIEATSRPMISFSTVGPLERALALVGSSRDNELRARLNCLLAAMSAQVGDVTAAIDRIGYEFDHRSAHSAAAIDCLSARQFIAVRAGDAQGAIRYGELALEELRRAGIDMPADEADLLEALGNSHSMEGDRARAEHYYELSRRKYAASVQQRGNVSGQVFQAALTSLSAGAPRQALELYDHGLDIAPSEGARAHLAFYRARALESAGRYAQARSTYQLARQLDPANTITFEASCLVGMASASMQLRDQALTTAYFSQAMALLSDPLSVYPALEGRHTLLRGQLELAAGRLEAARAQFDKILARTRKNESSLHAALGKAELELRAGNAMAALSSARTGLEIATNLQGDILYSSFTGHSWLMLGHVWQQHGDATQAHGAFERAVTHLSNTVDADHQALRKARRLLAGRGPDPDP